MQHKLTTYRHVENYPFLPNEHGWSRVIENNEDYCVFESFIAAGRKTQWGSDGAGPVNNDHTMVYLSKGYVRFCWKDMYSNNWKNSRDWLESEENCRSIEMGAGDSMKIGSNDTRYCIHAIEDSYVLFVTHKVNNEQKV